MPQGSSSSPSSTPRALSPEWLLVLLGAAIGFTVSHFGASVALAPGLTQAAAKMGALLPFFADVVAIVAGKLGRVEKHELLARRLRPGSVRERGLPIVPSTRPNRRGALFLFPDRAIM